MVLPSLRILAEIHRERILRGMIEGIAELPWSPYQQFLVQTKEGRGRLRTWLDLYLRALSGDTEAFWEDQERIGYERSQMEGFSLESLTEFYSIFMRIFWKILQEEVSSRNENLPGIAAEVQNLNDILFKGYGAIARSYVKSREERVVEKVNQLQDLNRFTREVITLFELDELVPFFLRRMATLLGVEEAQMALCRNGKVQGTYRHTSPGSRTTAVKKAMERALKKGAICFLDERGGVFRYIHDHAIKHVVSIPIQVHGTVYGVLCLCNGQKGFVFLDKELGLLNQFLHIMGVALENAFMLKENREAREQLHLLTGQMITIQEEERRKLAGDIHDTLTQALIGISYKIQFCREIAGSGHDLLLDQMDGLLETVTQAIDQSRALISSLRPDLLDTMGLVPALKRHIENFSRESGIQVRTRFPRKILLPVEVNICLFRIAQEALMNVYKHAETRSAEVALSKRNGKVVFVVADKGKGFDPARSVLVKGDANRLGLLSMRERIESAGGRLSIRTAEDRGCRIEVTIPCSGGASHEEKDPGSDR